MKIKKGDKITVIAGKDKGKTGKVVKSIPAVLKIVVEGINLKKKHTRPRKEGQKGQIIQSAYPFDVSNAKLVCPKCDKPTRVGYMISSDNKKTRMCKKCQSEI